MLGCGQTPSSQLHYKRDAEAGLGPNITGATWELGRTLKLIVAGLLLEELLISRICFIFFSNWGGIYIEQG